MPNTPDITIIGGGAIGQLTAREFVNAGLSVSIIDKSLSGQESSWAGGGILLPLYPWRQPKAISSLVIESNKNYSALSQDLFQATRIDPEWYDCGLLICKNPDHELAVAWCEQHQINFKQPDNTLIEGLHTEMLNPLWLPNIAQARNPRLLKSLKTYLLSKGVNFIENCAVQDAVIENGKVQQLITDQGHIATNQLIICTGAWTAELSKKLLPEDNHTPNISPVKGQMLLFDAEPETLLNMVLDDDQYLIPRRDGKILAGSSVEHTDFDKSTSQEAKDKLARFAIDLFPALKKFPISHHWAGLRPGTHHGIPYIDRHPDIDNLSINAGHFRNGLVMGPASACLMADLILDRLPCIDPEPYRLK